MLQAITIAMVLGMVGISSASPFIPALTQYVDPYGWPGYGGWPDATEGTFPGGGSPNAPAVINSRNGNRLTIVPIVSWTNRGGLPFEFNLYHNSRQQGGFGGAPGFGAWSHSFDWRSADSTTGPGDLQAFDLTHYVKSPDGNSFGCYRTVVGNQFRYLPENKSLGYLSFGGETNNFANPATQGQAFIDKFGTAYLFKQIVPGTGAGAPPRLFAVEKIFDRAGNEIEVVRNWQNGLIQEVRDSTNRKLVFQSLGSNSWKIREVLPDTPTVREWKFIQEENLTKVVYPELGDLTEAQRTRTFTMQNNRIISETDLNGNNWTAAYNTLGMCTDFASPSFNSAHNGTYYIGRSVEYADVNAGSYLLAQQATLKMMRGPNTVEDSTIKHEYTGGGLSKTTDEAGAVTEYAGDAVSLSGFSQVTIDGAVWQYTLDATNFGNVTSVLTPTGERQDYTYDANSNVTSVTGEIKPSRTTFEYTNGALSKAYRPPSVSGGYGTPTLALYSAAIATNGLVQSSSVYHNGLETTSYDYDSHGSLSSVTAPTGKTWTLENDALGRVKKILQPAILSSNDATQFTYDGWGRPISVINPDGSVSSVKYDLEGRVIESKDELLRTTYYTYEPNGLLKTVTNPAGDVTTYSHDMYGNVVRVTDPEGFVRSYEYTKRGEVSKLTDTDGVVETWTYDLKGNVTSHIEGVGLATPITTAYTYDLSGRVLTVDKPGTANDLLYAYDKVVNWAGAEVAIVRYDDKAGDAKELYNGFGHLLRIYEGQGAGQAQAAKVYYPDELGRNKKTWETTFQNTLYNYDAFGRLLSVVNPHGKTFSFGYDDRNRVISVQSSAGFETIKYDSRSRPTEFKMTQSGNVVSLEQYEYDAVGNIVSHTVDGQTTTYAYDLADRLVSESGAVSNTYTYYRNGDRKTKNGSLYQYDAQGRLVYVQGMTMTYDGFGRMVTRGNQTFTWDNDHRLVSVSVGGSVVQSNVYNGRGARVRQTANGLTNVYRRDGLEVDAPVTYDGFGHVTAGLARQEGTVSTELKGGVKNTSTQVSPGAVAKLRYDAFGNIVGGSGTWAGNEAHGGGFGYQTDSTGLQLLGHRWYDPLTGRFISKDPIGSGDNWYAYCDNNPLNWADPKGLVKITLMFREVRLGIYHAFLQIEDNVPGSPTFGQKYNISAGPQNEGDYLNLGALVDKSGPLNKGAYDKVRNPGFDIVLRNDADEYTGWKDAAQSIATKLDKTQLYDSANGPNSNSFAREVIDRLGLTPALNAELKNPKKKIRIPLAPGWRKDPWQGKLR